MADEPVKLTGWQAFIYVSIAIIGVITFGLWDNGLIGGDKHPQPEPVEVVHNSAWDGSVRQVEDFLRARLNDPYSVKYEKWSKVIKGKNGYMVRVRYRAKNKFGAYVLQDQVFSLDKHGNVTNVIDWPGE